MFVPCQCLNAIKIRMHTGEADINLIGQVAEYKNKTAYGAWHKGSNCDVISGNFDCLLVKIDNFLNVDLNS